MTLLYYAISILVIGTKTQTFLPDYEDSTSEYCCQTFGTPKVCKGLNFHLFYFYFIRTYLCARPTAVASLPTWMVASAPVHIVPCLKTPSLRIASTGVMKKYLSVLCPTGMTSRHLTRATSFPSTLRCSEPGSMVPSMLGWT